MKSTLTTTENKTYSIGKIINVKEFKLNCNGCKSKFNSFVKYGLTPDSMKWDCQNCSSEFSMFYQDLNLADETTIKIIVFHKRHGETKHKEYGLINDSVFRELTEVSQ